MNLTDEHLYLRQTTLLCKLIVEKGGSYYCGETATDFVFMHLTKDEISFLSPEYHGWAIRVLPGRNYFYAHTATSGQRVETSKENIINFLKHLAYKFVRQDLEKQMINKALNRNQNYATCFVESIIK